MKRKHLPLSWIIPFLIAGVLWETLAQPTVLPPLSAVLARLALRLGPELFRPVASTLLLAMVAYGLALLVGLPVGALLRRSEGIRRSLTPFLWFCALAAGLTNLQINGPLAMAADHNVAAAVGLSFLPALLLLLLPDTVRAPVGINLRLSWVGAWSVMLWHGIVPGLSESLPLMTNLAADPADRLAVLLLGGIIGLAVDRVIAAALTSRAPESSQVGNVVRAREYPYIRGIRG